MAAATYYESSVASTGAVATYTHSITPPAGHSDVALLVTVHFYNDPGAVTGTNAWNGVALSVHGTHAADWGGGSTGYIRTFRLVAPTSDGSAHNLILTWTNATRAQISALFVEDADQTTPFDDPDDATGTGTQAANTVTSATGDLVLGTVSILSGTDPTFVMNGTGQTQIHEVFNGTASLGLNLSYLPGAASTGFDVSWTGSQIWYNRCVNVNAVAAAGGNPGSDLRTMPRGIGRGIARGLA